MDTSIYDARDTADTGETEQVEEAAVVAFTNSTEMLLYGIAYREGWETWGPYLDPGQRVEWEVEAAVTNFVWSDIEFLSCWGVSWVVLAPGDFLEYEILEPTGYVSYDSRGIEYCELR